jgi:hypothetical protein
MAMRADASGAPPAALAVDDELPIGSSGAVVEVTV